MVLTSLEGNKYSGRFNIEEKSYSWMGGNSEVGDRPESKSWYEGIGDIKNLETGEIQKFLFKSREKRGKNFGSLDEVFWTNIPEEKIVNREGIYDIVLESMYLQAEDGLKHDYTIIPEVTPTPLDEKELFHADLIKDPKYLEDLTWEI